MIGRTHADRILQDIGVAGVAVGMGTVHVDSELHEVHGTDIHGSPEIVPGVLLRVHQTVFEIVTGRDGIGGDLVTAGSGKAVIRHHGRMRRRVDPVEIVPVLDCLQLRWREDLVIVFVLVVVTGTGGFTGQLDIFFSGHHVGQVRVGTDTHIAAVIYAGLACLATAGGHEDDTVRGAGTVNGGGGGILQDVDALDVIRVDVLEGCALDSIDHHERSGAATDGVQTTDQDVVSAARLIVGTLDLDARKGSLEGAGSIGVAATDQVGGGNRSNRTGQVTLLDGTVTDHHRLIQHLRILGERHDHSLPQGGLRINIPETGDDDGGTRACIDGESAVRVRDGAVRRTLHNYRSSDDRLSAGIDHPARHALLCVGDCPERQGKHGNGSLQGFSEQ